ncbi:hypothetical protein LMG26690_01331 [Achromobacter animicus]|uniref:Sialate O-acetylesterase domain-containing protein n=1 Tax=Achromobacter animicus TaxID=1389935 RepID=A0A6S6ZI24_9BURK|nr:sialate O-acetylesterase [Achromobacter animicus]CAB3676050.1 hypothetical protein LMG26690_01331 [Achromobacter animicus]
MGYITPQELKVASLDAGTLRKFATGSAGQPNINRVGVDVKNLATIRVEALDAASAAANLRTYLTKAVMDADTSQPVPTTGRVVKDPTVLNNGDYVWTGSSWEWSEVQPATSAAVQAVRSDLVQTETQVMARSTPFRVLISSWDEQAQDIVVDPDRRIVGGGDVLESHERRISAVEQVGGFSEIDGLVIQGQSNARGARGLPLDPTTTDALYPNAVLMPAGPGMNVVCGTAGGEDYGPLDPAAFEGFQSLVSMDLGSGAGTTHVEGMAFAIALRQAEEGSVRRTLSWSTAKGGASLGNRSPGTIPYENTLTALDRSVAIAEALGASYSVKAIATVEGEADAGNTAYAENLIDVYAGSLTTAILARTGQKHLPPILMAQPSSFFASVDGAMGIYNVCKQHPRFHLVCAGYHLPYSDDLLHYSSRGNVKLGEYFAKALNYVRLVGSWRPLMPKMIRWDGEKGIDVWFHVPQPPIVHDLSMPDHGDWGFDVRSAGANVGIASIEIVGPDSIHIETAAPLTTNRFLRYAMRGYQSSPRQPGDGPIGSLRDSDSTPSFTDGAPLYNWCVHFSEQF